jgi:hypothetical protein
MLFAAHPISHLQPMISALFEVEQEPAIRLQRPIMWHGTQVLVASFRVKRAAPVQLLIEPDSLQ